MNDKLVSLNYKQLINKGKYNIHEIQGVESLIKPFKYQLMPTTEVTLDRVQCHFGRLKPIIKNSFLNIFSFSSDLKYM